MEINFKDEKDFENNPNLKKIVSGNDNSVLKTWLVDYVGNKKNPEDNNVTVEMIIETISEEFPEFIFTIAEENWIRGYHQALTDAHDGEQLYRAQINKNTKIEDE